MYFIDVEMSVAFANFKIIKCVIIYFLFKESLSSLILYLYFCINLLKESPPNCISLRPHKPGSSLLPASMSIWTKDLFFFCPGEPAAAWATTFPEQFCQWVLQEEQMAFLLGSLFWGPWRSFPEHSCPRFSGFCSCWERQQQGTAVDARSHQLCRGPAVQVLLLP